MMENLYVFKGYGAGNLLGNFRIKVADCRDWINFWKSCRRQARRQDESAALNTHIILRVFLFCNIHTQTRYYEKGIGHLVAYFLSCITTKYY